MTPVSETLREEYETELSRLGSSKVLYALTDGEMDADAVTAVAAGRALVRAETLETLADATNEGGADAATGETIDVFVDGAAAEREYADALGGGDPVPPPVDDALRAVAPEADARLGGVLAATLVEKRITEQVVGFFVGRADPNTADAVRDHVSTLDERLDALADALEGETPESGDATDALEAGRRVIEAAYDEYVDRLEARGVNPKPVC